MKRFLLLPLLSIFSMFSVAGTTASYTTPKSSGIVWIIVSPVPNGDWTIGNAKLSVSIGGRKILSSYSMAKNNTSAPFVIGIPHYEVDAASVSVVSEEISWFSTKKANIVSVKQGDMPGDQYKTVLVCGRNFTPC